jgi:outer membrane cobalamin receptor
VTYLQTDEKQTMKINDNLLGIDYNHAFEKAKLFADAQYTYSGFNYYGYEKATPDIYAINQVNNLFRIHSGIASEDNDEITYKVNLAYTLFKQKYGNFDTDKGRTENRLMADVDLHAHFNSTAGIGIRGSVKNYSYTIPMEPIISETLETILGNQDYTTFFANPYLTFEGDNWNTRLGASANAQVGGIKKFMVAPDVRFNWYPAEQFLFYLSVEGGIKDNSNYDLYYENRYIDPTYRIYDSKSPLDGTIGIDFSPASNWSIGLFTGYQMVKNEHFYLMLYSPYILNTEYFADIFIIEQSIIPQYGDAQIFKLGGSLKYAYQDIFDFSLKGTYYHWDVKKLSDNSIEALGLTAWNKPAFVGDLNLGYKIPVVPFHLDLTYHLETGRKSFNINTWNAESMKNIHDVSFAGTYTLNETIAVFAKANNLLFQKYDLWYGYPAQNFNIMLGVNIKF